MYPEDPNSIIPNQQPNVEQPIVRAASYSQQSTQNDQNNLHQQSSPNQQSAGSINSNAFQTMIPTKNKQALLSYYFGIFGFIPFLGIPLSILAIVFGIMGLSKYKINPTPGAKGHALAGIILGSVELLIFVFLVLFIVIVGSKS